MELLETQFRLDNYLLLLNNFGGREDLTMRAAFAIAILFFCAEGALPQDVTTAVPMALTAPLSLTEPAAMTSPAALTSPAPMTAPAVMTTSLPMSTPMALTTSMGQAADNSPAAEKNEKAEAAAARVPDSGKQDLISKLRKMATVNFAP
jgi:hypothetical protein